MRSCVGGSFLLKVHSVPASILYKVPVLVEQLEQLEQTKNANCSTSKPRKYVAQGPNGTIGTIILYISLNRYIDTYMDIEYRYKYE